MPISMSPQTDAGSGQSQSVQKLSVMSVQETASRGQCLTGSQYVQNVSLK